MKFYGLILLLGGAVMTVSAKTVHLPLRSFSADADGRSPRGITKYQRRETNASSGVNVPVTDWFNGTDNQWYTTFSVGTPPQNFTALFDTGSPSFIVGASNCTTCGDKKLFDPELSSTYVDEPGRFVSYLFSTGADSLPFAEPEGATGYEVQDTISLGDLTVENQTFVLCVTMAEALDVMPIDGIMGMGFPEADSSWYWNLVDEGQLDSSVYSFYIPAGDIDGGEVTLGGIDDTKYEGDLNWVKLNIESKLFGSYVVDWVAIYANGQLLNNGTSPTTGAAVAMPTNGLAILDTGTAFMQTPDYATAVNLYAQISPNITLIDPAGAWGAPCDELESIAPDLTFTIGTAATAINVTIPKASFNLGEYPGLDGICQALFNNPSDGIGSSWFVGKKAEWLVGSPLIKQYYTAWDADNLQVGWGQLVDGPGFTAE
ncbi:acid protease [Cryphonectria parasitica EP155]|uniref:Acid protease n=1 Tax=Cryphonectria parasitica (strain ATCC 38755 / EP155) TaxID=660469 RepID=A0A9P5CI91_CRYP1|nr:acid protease [Cryphonectria parasitica EP155]KAF3760594.1 acid protease [Cryphonectria parasitica EP155]